MASNAMQEMIVTTQNFRRKGMKEREKGEGRKEQVLTAFYKFKSKPCHF